MSCWRAHLPLCHSLSCWANVQMIKKTRSVVLVVFLMWCAFFSLGKEAFPLQKLLFGHWSNDQVIKNTGSKMLFLAPATFWSAPFMHNRSSLWKCCFKLYISFFFLQKTILLFLVYSATVIICFFRLIRTILYYIMCLMWPIRERSKVIIHSDSAITIIIGHMQIRAKYIMMLLCKRWGHVTLCDWMYWFAQEYQCGFVKEISPPRSHVLYSKPSPFTRFLSCCHFFPSFISHLPIQYWLCFISFNPRFPFQILILFF